MSELITINVKSSTADSGKASIQISTDKTVMDLKNQIATEMQIPVDQQRLIFSGKILKDPELLSSYKITSGHTVHLVRGGVKPPVPAGSSVPPVATPAATTAPRYTAPAATSPQAAAPAFPAAAAFGTGGGFGAQPGAAGIPPGLAALLGNGAGLSQPQQGGIDPMAQMMQMMLSNPQLMEQMMASNPMLSQMGVSPQQMRQMMSDPMFQSLVSNPQLLSGIMQSAMAQQQQGGMPGFDATTASGLPPLGMPFFNPALAAGMGGFPGAATSPAAGSPTGTTGAGATNQQPQVPPETRYATQLQQLQDMGFFDPALNLRAIVASQGNVNLAVEWLLRQL